jgi:hypothetical protein
MNVLTTECQKANKELVFAGTDYGVKTLSTTVPITLSTYERHLEMFNLSARSANQESCPQLPRPLRITAGQIDQLCLSKAHTRKRRKRKQNSPQVQLAEDMLSRNSIQLAKTVGDAIECHLVGLQTRQVLRDFYYSPRSMKEKRVQEFRTKATYDRLAAAERAVIKDAAQCTEAVPVLCIGTAGTGVGSRIRGNARRGGKKLRGCHKRYTVVAMTNEFRTSQTCVYCFQQLRRPQAKRMVNGVIKAKSITGSSLCMNPNCISYKCGLNTQNRDVEAAFAIALSGVSRLLAGRPLSPFDPR